MTRNLILLCLSLCALGKLSSEKLVGLSNPYKIIDIKNTMTSIVMLAKYNLSPAEEFNTPIVNLTVIVDYFRPTIARITITDHDNLRFGPKDATVFNAPSGQPTLYNVEIHENPMGITIRRNSDNKIIFNLDPNNLFEFYDTEITFANDVGYPIKVMGLGERIAPFILPRGTYTMWSRDRASPYDDGDIAGQGNMYSVHPFYLAVDEEGSAFGAALINASAQDAIVGDEYVAHHLTGGYIEYYVFTGPTPSSVIQSYHEVVGYPVLVPYWSYGYHQSRYGWNSLKTLKKVNNKFDDYKLPLDGIWSDIDDMLEYVTFSLDSARYNHDKFLNWVKKLNSMGRHFIPIVNAGIGNNTAFKQPYEDLLKEECFIKDPYSSSAKPIIAMEWSPYTAFVDWSHPSAYRYWMKQLKTYHELTSYSGLWLSMNEVSSFVSGSVDHKPTALNCTNGLLRWCPGGVDLNKYSLDIAAKHFYSTEFNWHSLYGFYESSKTSEFLNETLGLRPFIISRSTFPGHGRFASKSLGDNYSQFDFLEYSIIGVYNFQMFGIPFVGADICGYLGNTNEELCSRWMQLGALYPLSRNHNDIQSIDQEPWSFGSTLLEATEKAVRNKYKLFLYYYSGMFRLSQKGGMFFKPVFFNYDNDLKLYSNLTRSFLLGDSLLIHPCITPGITKDTVYFPEDVWFDFYEGTYVQLGHDNLVDLDMPLSGNINIHIKAGSVIPIPQNYQTAMTLQELRKSNVTLLAALSNDAATGFAIYDDGLDPYTIKNGIFSDVTYVFRENNKSIYFDIKRVGYTNYNRPDDEFPYLTKFVMYNCSKWPKAVNIVKDSKLIPVEAVIDWDSSKYVCTFDIIGDNLPKTDQEITMEFEFYA